MSDNIPMKSILSLILFMSFQSVQAQNLDPVGLTYYLTCHKKLDELIESEPEKYQSTSCEAPAISDSMGNIPDVINDLNLKEHLLYLSREQDLQNEEIQSFLKKCTEKSSEFHREIGDLALEAYDISFLNRDQPVLENGKDGIPPHGYKVSKYYGNQPESCYQSGFKAALFIPEKGDHVVFSITGTEGSDTYTSGKVRETYLSEKRGYGIMALKKSVVEVSAKTKDREDWLPVTGKKQFSTECANQMMKDAFKLASSEGKKIVFTGHSLGGALSQAMSYYVQKNLDDKKIKHSPVESITFMAAGGARLIAEQDNNTIKKMHSTSYISLGDLVSQYGGQVGEIRELIRKSEYEDKFKSKELSSLDTHSLKLDQCEPLKDSLSLSANESSKRCSAYKKSLRVPDDNDEKE